MCTWLAVILARPNLLCLAYVLLTMPPKRAGKRQFAIVSASSGENPAVGTLEPVDIPDPLPISQQLDDEARAAYNKMSKKAKRQEGGWNNAERNAMRRTDVESAGSLAIAALAAHFRTPPAPTTTRPLFKNGQSIIQWWASWMSEADEIPKSYAGNNRPKWFNGEVCTYFNFGTIRYAGVTQAPDHLYYVF